jgi:lantibiotic leader peptide-processing serine protease
MQWTRWTPLSLALIVGLAGCSGDPTNSTDENPELSALNQSVAGRFVVIGVGGTLPADLASKIAAAGGTLVESVDQIGVAIASSDKSTFRANASRIPGIESVTPDHILQWTEPVRTEEFGGETAASVQPQVASLADNEPLYAIQWAPAAVHAPEAWNAGYTGQGVRVAILDGGLYNAHPDLSANIDVAASTSFVAGQPFNNDVGTFWHGTHVAGIVAAGDNSIGVIGIAPHATLIGVKVLHNGSGSFEAVINGIVYAGTPVAEGGAGAQVINMSLGATIEDSKSKVDGLKADIKELMKAVSRATQYATQRGTVVIAAAGNAAVNHDVNDVVTIPAQNLSVISIAATGPVGWALGATNFSRSASYTNYGKQLVTFAAPGGDFVYPGTENCTVGGITRACFVFDYYLSTSRAGYTWAVGTSMAAPVASGIAALIIQSAGGTLAPDQVKQRLEAGALDYGKTGVDPYYGLGFVDAYRSVVP